MEDASVVFSYVSMCEATAERGSDPAVSDLCDVASGAAYLRLGNYRLAARRLTDVKVEGGTQSVLSPQGIAVVGGLCALATFDRVELKDKVIDSPTFSGLLDLSLPVRNLVLSFYESRYHDFIGHSAEVEALLRFDWYMGPHVKTLLAQARAKALTQFFAPFSAVDLALMAAAFRTTYEAICDEVAALIAGGKIVGRIDTHNRTLVARQSDPAKVAVAEALGVARGYLVNTQAALIRNSIVEHGLVVKGKGRGRNQGHPEDRDDRPGMMAHGADGDGGGGARPTRQAGASRRA
jgi:COP9 signalosome complex subunit 1